MERVEGEMRRKYVNECIKCGKLCHHNICRECYKVKKEKRKFCPICNKELLTKSRTRKFCSKECGEEGRRKWGNKYSREMRVVASEKIKEVKEIVVVKGKEINTDPVIVETCKKCGHGEAYFWTIQTRAGDEAETKFFKCTKCEHTWRDYR